MSLVDEAMTSVQLIEKTREPDGEGGFITGWKDGAKFKAAITFDSSMQGRRAEKEGVSSLYTVTAPKSANLMYHDVFKRLSDGKIFRVTSDSDDIVTPDRATFQFRQFTAEEFELPND